jgi:hypothetical protein
MYNRGNPIHHGAFTKEFPVVSGASVDECSKEAYTLSPKEGCILSAKAAQAVYKATRAETNTPYAPTDHNIIPLADLPPTHTYKGTFDAGHRVKRTAAYRSVDRTIRAEANSSVPSELVTHTSHQTDPPA